MREALLIARREYLERVRSKAFRISTLLIPLVFAAIIGIGALSGKLNSGPQHVVLVSDDAALAESVRAELTRQPGSTDGGDKQDRRAQLTVEVKAPAGEADLKPLVAAIESKQIDAFLWLHQSPGKTLPEATYASRGSADFIGNGRMQDAIGHAVLRGRLARSGVTLAESDQLLGEVSMKTQAVKHGQLVSSDTGKSFWGGYVMAFLLYFAVTFYGMNVAQSVVAEKTSRVFEVLLSSATPQALMTGKLIGVAGAGLTQMAIWIGGVLLLSASSLGAALGQGGLAAFGVTPLKLIFFFLYFILGFLFYSSISAGFGASVSQESEVQQFSMVIVLPQLIGLMLTVYILSNPNAWPVVLLSLFPPCTPIVMCLRMSAQTPPLWQLGLSIVLMVAAIWIVLWIASRIYRVGILMYGKRPTLPEMVRWMRYS